MTYLAIILFTFLFGFVAVDGVGLRCYQCLHFEDAYVFESSCLNNPILNLSSTCKNDQYGGQNQAEMCVTVTGVVNGAPIIGRGCWVSHSYELAEKCVEMVNYPMPIIGKNASHAKLCYCATDNCNGSSGSSAAIRLQYITLFAFAVQLWYRFESIH